MNKPTFKQQVLALLATHGPLTKRQILTFTGHKVTSMVSYFATVDQGCSPYYTAEHYAKLAKASLVASGTIVKVGKAGKEVLYGLPQA